MLGWVACSCTHRCENACALKCTHRRCKNECCMCACVHVATWRYLRRHSKAYAGTRPKIMMRMKVPTSCARDASIPNMCRMLPAKNQKMTTGTLATVTHNTQHII